jgi:protein-S-isoprenylcysteine O-methyltransferase Ste14
MGALARGYAGLCYLCFLASFAYLVAFLLDLPVPRTVDRGPVMLPTSALAVDVGLLLVFGAQHSVMARDGFKRLWTRVVPAVVERSTYVLATAAVLGFIFWQWRPIPSTIWYVENVPGQYGIYAVFALGLLLMGLSSLATDHFELFGLRSPALADDQETLVVEGLYRFVRHPMMLGIFLMLWATPSMSIGHLVFSVGMSAYVVLGTFLEEAALVQRFGAPYVEYCRRVPMLLPIPRPRPRQPKNAAK